MSENGKILPSRITNVSHKRNKENYLFQLKELETWLYYNMKVILLENVKRIGSIGEVIEVKRGYARNFLISNKKALICIKRKY